ncbi:head maturation protease, ClpP-related [Paenibacillus spongiae]|uniref:ATP-dependent Clp protease proteolytic subunit n=1 Tax=Paenibacillus spongiae TaxID=2909671 RepID=A0ABY5SH80_9BACL|nr:head maturation protease, ClpP-related [Paenibacillus spongiae]UVI32082.1 Clp protease ClpP [Paenibacillus spongiae]
MKWLNVKNAVDKAELYIYGDIVGSEWDKWTDTDTAPEDVLTLLSEIGENKPLDIYINSGGGSVFAGLAIYNILKRHPGYKIAYIDGLAASISSVIPFAANKIIIPSNSFMMIHKPWNWMAGNANDYRKMADDLDRIEQGILNVYQENLVDGVDIETIRGMVNAETWINGNEVANYFRVEVVGANNIAASITDRVKAYTNVPQELLNQSHVSKRQDEEQIELMKMQLELL